MLWDRKRTRFNTLCPNSCSLHLTFFSGECLAWGEPGFIRLRALLGHGPFERLLQIRATVHNAVVDDKPNPAAIGNRPTYRKRDQSIERTLQHE